MQTAGNEDFSPVLKKKKKSTSWNCPKQSGWTGNISAQTGQPLFENVVEEVQTLERWLKITTKISLKHKGQ